MMTVETTFTPGFNMDGDGGGGGKRVKREQIKGLSHYRILPPFGTNHRGVLYKRYQQHWGFTSENGYQIPIACSYPTDRYCPICSKVKEAETELLRLKGGDKYKKIEDLAPESRTVAKELDDYVRTYRVENVYVYNAATVDGRAVVLQLKWTAHVNLWGDDKEKIGKIKECVQKFQFDPTSMRTGVWFTFNRTGKNLDTDYPVDFKKTVTVINGGPAEVLDRNPLPEEFVQSVEAQLKAAIGGVAPGPLTDIHTLLEPKNAAELAAIMNGGAIQTRAESVYDGVAGSTVRPQDDVDESKLIGAQKYAEMQAGATPVPAPIPVPVTSTTPVYSTPVLAPLPIYVGSPVVQSVPQTMSAQAAPGVHHHAHVSVPTPTAPAAAPVTAPAGNLAAEVARLKALQARVKKPMVAPAQ
jgi:hypothetical protein